MLQLFIEHNTLYTIFKNGNKPEGMKMICLQVVCMRYFIEIRNSSSEQVMSAVKLICEIRRLLMNCGIYSNLHFALVVRQVVVLVKQ